MLPVRGGVVDCWMSKGLSRIPNSALAQFEENQNMLALIKARQLGGHRASEIPEREEFPLLRGYLQSVSTAYRNYFAFGLWERWVVAGRSFHLTGNGLSEWAPEEEESIFITADESQAIAYLRSLGTTDQ
jgi:hypothetical protein